MLLVLLRETLFFTRVLQCSPHPALLALLTESSAKSSPPAPSQTGALSPDSPLLGGRAVCRRPLPDPFICRSNPTVFQPPPPPPVTAGRVWRGRRVRRGLRDPAPAASRLFRPVSRGSCGRRFIPWGLKYLFLNANRAAFLCLFHPPSCGSGS